MSTQAAEAKPVARQRTFVKPLVAAAVFSVLAVIACQWAPTIEVAWVLAFLFFTVYLFAFEIVAVDVAAVTVMVLLGLSSLLAPLMGLEKGLVDPAQLFDGFSSNAVISIIAVMIIGAGLDKTGIMNRVAEFILGIGGSTERRITPIVSSTVGLISSFMQNVGATALFIPVVSRISARTGLPLSRLLMPMGFCAILGGTITMVGSSPLILLNDLILNSNQALDPEHQMETWSLFSVTPVGLLLLAAGIAYFVLAGRYVLPATAKEGVTGEDTMRYFRETYGLACELFELPVPKDSAIVGKTLDDVEHGAGIRVVALSLGGEFWIGAGSLARDLGIEAGSVLGVTGKPGIVEAFAGRFGLEPRRSLETFREVLSPARAGVAELVIPPASHLVGKTSRDAAMRRTYGVSIIALHRAGRTFREEDGIRDIPFQSGDTLVVHTTWSSLSRLKQNPDLVVITTEYPHEELRPQKVVHAAVFFALALTLLLFTDLRLSVALLTGAIGMVLSGVISAEEAHRAVSWKTVFLLASLIPLGLAVETSGTAAWIAQGTLALLGDVPSWIVQLVLATLATFFTLVMSNVGATVLLVPLAVNIAVGVGADPAVFALTVAIATSNAFIIPTHQVNALIMGPGGYRVADFMRAGGIMTVLFLVVMMVAMNLFY